MVDWRWLHPLAGTETGHGFVQVYQQFEALAGRVAKIEKRINVAPIVVDETAYVPIEDVIENRPIRTMQASGLPSGWAILWQTMNGLPTTGYWAIDAKGVVTPTNIGAVSVNKHATVEIATRATNEFGSGDGKLDLRFI